jgi:hypothetical protein
LSVGADRSTIGISGTRALDGRTRVAPSSIPSNPVEIGPGLPAAPELIDEGAFMAADPDSSGHGGVLDLARALYRAADDAVAATDDRRRLLDTALAAGWTGPRAEEASALVAAEELAAADLAARLRLEADQWAAAWRDAVVAIRRWVPSSLEESPSVPVPEAPDYRPVPWSDGVDR